MSTDTSIRGEWVREQVQGILLEADPSAWRAEREADLRRRVRDVVAYLRRNVPESGVGQSSPPSRLRERVGALHAAMERALPTDATRARWAAFVGEVHPAYEALVDALGDSVAPRPIVRPTNYSRSVFHFGFALVALTAVLLLPSRGWLIAIPGAFMVYAWGMEIGRRRSPALNEALMRLYGKVAHPHERYRINSATWYATALVLLAIFATKPAMMSAIVVLGVADPVAGAIGRRFGVHKLRGGRSLEGSTAFFVSGALASAFILVVGAHLPWPTVAALSLLSGFVGALAELFSERLDDNFTIPVAVGAVATLVAPALG